jgi:hypothetical protein
MFLQEHIQNKWKPVLDHPALASITDQHRRSVTAIMLENTEQALKDARGAGDSNPSQLLETGYGIEPVPANYMGTSSSTQGAGGIDTFDPILISLVRRAMPALVAYDICGVQPMTGPSGLIFAMRSKYNNQGNGTAATDYSGVQQNDTFYNEVNTAFSSIVSSDRSRATPTPPRLRR